MQTASKILPLRQKKSITLKFPYDLRIGLEEKVLDAAPFGWTAFLNNSGSLVHLVHADGGFHVRLPMPFAAKGCHPAFIESTIRRMVDGKLAL